MTTKRGQNPVVCPGHSRPIVEVNFSNVTADGLFLVSASKDGCPMLRNGETGDWIGTFEGHKGAVWSCVLNAPAMLAATGSADYTARVWDAVSGDEKAQFQHKHIVRSVRFAGKREVLATAGTEKIIRLFDLENTDSGPTELPAAASPIRCLAWCQDDKVILSISGEEKGITVWDMKSNSAVRTLETPDPVTSIEVSADGTFITTTDGSTVRFWDAASFNPIKEVSLSFGVECASLNGEKDKYVVGGEDMSVRQYEYATGHELECNRKHHGPVHTVQYAPHGKTYASGSEDGTIRIWESIVANGEVEEPGGHQTSAAPLVN